MSRLSTNRQLDTSDPKALGRDTGRLVQNLDEMLTAARLASRERWKSAAEAITPSSTRPLLRFGAAPRVHTREGSVKLYLQRGKASDAGRPLSFLKTWPGNTVTVVPVNGQLVNGQERADFGSPGLTELWFDGSGWQASRPVALVYDVRDFGARGDGVTDDTEAIQAAMDALDDAGGGVLYFPPGTYLVYTAGSSIAITLKAGVRMQGAGWGASTIKLADSQAANVIVASLVDSIAVRDLTIDCNGANQSAGNGIIIKGCTDFAIERVEILSAKGGAIIVNESGTTGSERGLIYGCRVYSTLSTHGIALASASGSGLTYGPKHIRIVANDVINPFQSAINLSQCSWCTVSGNTVEGDGSTNGGYAGVRLSNGAEHNTVVGNSINSMSRGVFIVGDAGAGDGPCEFNVITGNAIEGCLNQGVLTESGYTTIAGNTVVDCQRSTADAAIRVSDANYCAITGNAVIDQAGASHQRGIQVSGTSDYATVVGNTIKGWTTLPLSVTGANSKVASNTADRTVSLASATSLSVLDHSDFFNITGTTTIDYIEAPTSSSHRVGRVLVLQFNAGITIRNNVAGAGSTQRPIRLSGAADFAATSLDMLTLLYNGVEYLEIARSVN
jgi:hypothetical protein